MSEYIAVKDCTLKLSVGDGTKTVTTAPSSVFKIDGKGVYAKEIIVSITDYLGGAITDGNGIGVGTIKSSAQYTKTEGEFVVLEGDESEQFTIKGTASGSYAEQVVTIKVQSAGQNFTKGE